MPGLFGRTDAVDESVGSGSRVIGSTLTLSESSEVSTRGTLPKEPLHGWRSSARWGTLPGVGAAGL
jgi:hypothetical protein